jgi:hypothetical protein
MRPPACQNCQNPSMIWMMNSQWMRMNVLILLIKSLYHPLHSNLPDIIYYIIPYISLSHCTSDKRHSLTATAINDLITAIPYHFPHSRSFTTGVSIFTSLTRAQNLWASSTPACTRQAVTIFLWPTQTRRWNCSGQGAWTMSCNGTAFSEN